LVVPPNKFSKGGLAWADLIALMRARGLAIADQSECTKALRVIGYYRLSAYMIPFQKGGGGVNRHDFSLGTDFAHILDLYTFDRQLRLVTADALERIEIALRTTITDVMCTSYDPFWYVEPKRFDKSYDFDANTDKIKHDIGYYDIQKRSVSIGHYYNTYGHPSVPPSWMVFESLSFGSVVYIFRHLALSDRKKISGQFNIDETLASSWFFSLSYARNLCAHHSRFWNRRFTIRPKIASLYSKQMDPNDTAYAQFVTMQILMLSIAPTSRWRERLRSTLISHPHIDPVTLGFPPEWDAKPPW
jgi:abortive infection bacteriophage resistance protein